MTLETKLQVCAGMGAVLALPMLHVGLWQGAEALAGLGLAVFGASMLVTPALRLRASGGA